MTVGELKSILETMDDSLTVYLTEEGHSGEWWPYYHELVEVELKAYEEPSFKGRLIEKTIDVRAKEANEKPRGVFLRY